MATLAQLGIALTGLQTDVKHVTDMVNGLTLKLKPALGPTYKVVCIYCHRTRLHILVGVCGWAHHYGRYCPQAGSPQTEPGSSSSPVFESARSLSPIMQTNITPVVASVSFIAQLDSWTDYREKCCP